MKLKHPLLMVSYFCSIKGNCPAEWADDKIRVLQKFRRDTLVLTGIGSHVFSSPGVRYVKVPSLSWNDYKEEIKELKAGGEKVTVGLYFFMPIAFTLGNIIDYILRKVTKGVSAGRWSWFITAFPVALWLKFRYRICDVFCTGGPTSSHVIGAFLVWLVGGRLFCEFQDPLLGATMTRSSLTRVISGFIEAILVRCSIRVAYVTKEAARQARERNTKYANRIMSIYPGAWKFIPQVRIDARDKKEIFEFLHLGTLYGSRNLDLFFAALDALREEGLVLAQSVRVVNLGTVYCETAPSYLARSDFQSLDALDRVEALKRAERASCLLLVQHADSRSRETIPYKFYDYLNIGLPLLGLTKNDELRQLIKTYGGYSAQADDLSSIKQTLRACLFDLASELKEPKVVSNGLDISTQFMKLLECADGNC